MKIMCYPAQGTASLHIDKIECFTGKLKKRSLLEVTKLAQLIVAHGLLTPILVANVDEKNYCIDGETRLAALRYLGSVGYETTQVPCTVIRAKQEELKSLVLATQSVFHLCTRDSLHRFDEHAKFNDYAFPEGKLINMSKFTDIDTYFNLQGGKFNAMEGKV